MTGKSEYVHGYVTASQTMAVRTADNFASFFTSYLTPGMSLLDVGCGPGTITVGLAAKVAPGQVVGIDVGASEVAKAAEHANSLGLKNTRFEVGDATALKFKDGMEGYRGRVRAERAVQLFVGERCGRTEDVRVGTGVEVADNG